MDDKKTASLIPLRICTALKQWGGFFYQNGVWFPYEFALLSNGIVFAIVSRRFDSPTNLHCSQTARSFQWISFCLIPLRICTALKLTISKNSCCGSLIPLRICTALKPGSRISRDGSSLIPLRICTALKPRSTQSQWFCCLIPLRICTALKPFVGEVTASECLIPLRICTALKRFKTLFQSIQVWFPYEFALLSNLKCLK